MAKKSTSKKSTGKAKKNEQSRLMQSFIHYFPAWLFLGVIIVLFIFGSTGKSFSDLPNPFNGNSDQDNNPEAYRGIYNTDAPLAALFTDSVEYWSPSIYRWAKEFNLNPNLVATVMQIESCGDPRIGSPAGAQGLFQIVPLYHFEDGDNQFDPDTNANAGLNHMNNCLGWTTDLNLDGIPEQEPDVGLALVCYNGGPSKIYDRNSWVQESFDYYTWGTGIWGDASSGHSTSQTLDAWLNASGIMCDDAKANLELIDPLNRFD